MLIGVHAGLVLLTTQVLSFSSPVALAMSALAAAALFSPLRSRIQQAAGRRFNRARYDADRTVAAYATRLQGEVDIRGPLRSARHCEPDPGAHPPLAVAEPCPREDCQHELPEEYC